MDQNRREFLGLLAKVAGTTALSGCSQASIQRALAVQGNRRTGSIRDVEHIVILTQENRSFDHYFGTLAGVRGFADPFPIPVANASGIQHKNVWYQPNATPTSLHPAIAPFRLNTVQDFANMRITGTPHAWPDAQEAWNEGRMNRWPMAKTNHSLGYFEKEDIPFQWALANAFTICDAYHCSMQAGTTSNRSYIWTGTNDGLATGNGPVMDNDYDWFDDDPGGQGGYAWITYCERLERAGIRWQVYENMKDNFTDNPLAGFRTFRDAWFKRPGYSQRLRDRGVSTRDLDALEEDVKADRLAQVSWVVATAEGSEHPGPSSPAQGADYTAHVLDALTSNPEVWSKTVLLINFDENDGFFDHVPPPAPPSYLKWDALPTQSILAGASTVDTSGEYHEHMLGYHNSEAEQALRHRPYGLGPRVPLYVVSPWSKGGWVNSQVFDHTSVIRFVEARFGVREPNISPWRREVCGDLLSAFNFSQPDNDSFLPPDTTERAERARALTSKITPTPPSTLTLPTQESGIRPSRALPYELHVVSQIKPRVGLELTCSSTGSAAAVFHVYDRFRLADVPRRYTVGSGKSLSGIWEASSSDAYDLWVIGPNGFHRHFTGRVNASDDSQPSGTDVRIEYDTKQEALQISLVNAGNAPAVFTLVPNKYYAPTPTQYRVSPQEVRLVVWKLENGPWYDFSITVEGQTDFSRRFAGRMETGADSFSDPAMGGSAVGEQERSVSVSFQA